MNIQQVEDIPMLGNINKSQVPPIDHKRILAFVNTFIINTVTFLNKFAVNCETKFIDFETKLQKVEASLLIIEGKLASIPDNDEEILNENKNIVIKDAEKTDGNDSTETQANVMVPVNENETINALPSEDQNDDIKEVETMSNGIKACEDDRYRKYFKMLQFGVPNQAVKLKMESEGCDSSILDNPNKILQNDVQRNDEE